MNTDMQLKALDRDIETNKRLIDMAKSLERLESNPDFKQIIEQNYLRDEAVRLVHLKAETNMQNDKSQRTITNDIDAIGSFAQFLTTIRVAGRNAEHSLSADEFTRTEILSGEFNG